MHWWVWVLSNEVECLRDQKLSMLQKGDVYDKIRILNLQDNESRVEQRFWPCQNTLFKIWFDIRSFSAFSQLHQEMCWYCIIRSNNWGRCCIFPSNCWPARKRDNAICLWTDGNCSPCILSPVSGPPAWFPTSYVSPLRRNMMARRAGLYNLLFRS